MKQAKAILKLNLILLLKDKISLIWSLLLPTIMLIISFEAIKDPHDLVYWWTYIFFNSFIYGVGLHALEEKDSGTLTFIYSIKWINFQFFLGCVLTQIVYGMVCMILFNVIASILLGFNFFTLCIFGFLSLLICLPISFISYNLTYVKGLYSSSISSICNILIFSMFIIIGFETIVNKYNPLYIISEIQIFLLDGVIPYSPLLVLLFLSVLSLPSIYFFKPISIETR